MNPEKIGAFFDLDGTIVAAPSLEWRFVAHLLARDVIGTRDIARWLAHFAKKIPFDPREAISGNKRYLAGLRESLTTEWEVSLAESPLQIYPAAIERMLWHRNLGHRVFLISGTLECLAQAAARRLPGPLEICATRLEANAGRWSGLIAGAHMGREEKARAARMLASRWGLSLWDSYAYGNSMSDLPMLDCVGHRAAVNPGGRLRQIACSEEWTVYDWRAAVAAGGAAHGLAAGEAR